MADKRKTKPSGPAPATLWLAIRLPHLALDLFSRGYAGKRDLPMAVSDGNARRPCALDCNPAAARHGIHPGLALSAARGLSEGLCLAERDTAAEDAALQRLAAWCYQYSSLVCLVPERASLLMEAGGSRKLFGTARGLARRLESELLRLGYHAHTGTAPTPEAAHLAARQGMHIRDAGKIRHRLGTLPADVLGLDAGQRAALSKMGFRTVAEILRLPRKALARHLGPSAADYLDRLTGARPDPQHGWRPPRCFSSEMGLAAETDSSQGLLFPLRRLVGELCGVLRASDRGVQEIRIRLVLRRGEESLRLGLQRPAREEARFMPLLRERLERLRLPGPVRRIRLEAGEFLPFDIQQQTLFEDRCDTGAQAVEPLLERLQARLGARAVTGLRGVEDHRPEYSWAARAFPDAAHCVPLAHRPPWLFTRARRCRIEDYHVLAGPERIETGWWDGHDCRRDYFVVQAADGRMLWAYREYKPSPGWYLQGIFG